MADTKLTANASQPRAPAQAGAAEEEEVYSTLGALLGTLEVVQADDDHRLAPVQLERMRSAIGFVRRMQHQVEALLILAGDDLAARLRCTSVRVAPLIEHAVRSAKRACDGQSITVQMIARDRWAEARVHVDGSRVDRALGALVEALAGSVGRGGAIDVTLERVGGWVALELVGHPSNAVPAAERGGELVDAANLASGLLTRGCERLFALQGGELSVDPRRPSVRLLLPTSEAT